MLWSEGWGIFERGDLWCCGPLCEGGLRVAAEGDDGLDLGSADQVVEAVAPLQLVGVSEQGECVGYREGVDGVGRRR